MPCTGLPLGCSILLPALYTPFPSTGPHPKSPGSVRQPRYPQGHPVFAVGSFAAADSHGPCFLRESREDGAGDRGTQQPRVQADADRVQIPALQVAPPGLISPSRKHLSRGATAKSSPGQALAHTQTYTHTLHSRLHRHLELQGHGGGRNLDITARGLHTFWGLQTGGWSAILTSMRRVLVME